jgi:flagellin-like hook-associated protein FlgL
MKQALDQKNQELQQLRDEIKRMSDNAANNDKSLLAEFLKLKLQHEYGQQDTILKAQLDQGADTAKAEAESTKAELGVQKEILSLEEQKLKTAQAFAGDVKNEA